MPEIEYCGPCGCPGRAGQVERALLSSPGRHTGALGLKPGRGRVYRERADGKVIYGKNAGPFDVTVIVRSAGQRLAQGAVPPMPVTQRPC